MFLGHFGIALAAKKLNHTVSLGTTFLAAQFIDLLWPFFLISGLEKVEIDPGNTAFTPLNFVSYPYSHSLAGVICWAILFSVIYFFLRKNPQGAILLGVLVLSHWILDFITHRPDLPITFTGTYKAGLGLWNDKTATLIVELLMFFLGCYLYIRSTAAVSKWGTISLWSMIIFFLAVYFMNVYGDPPPDTEMIGYAGLAQWILIAWGYWTDSQRKPVR